MHESVSKARNAPITGSAGLILIVLAVMVCLSIAAIASCGAEPVTPQRPALLGRSFSLNGKTWTIINRRCGYYDYQVAAIDDHEGSTLWFDEPAAAKLVDLHEHPAMLEPAPGGRQ